MVNNICDNPDSKKCCGTFLAHNKCIIQRTASTVVILNHNRIAEWYASPEIIVTETVIVMQNDH